MVVLEFPFLVRNPFYKITKLLSPFTSLPFPSFQGRDGLYTGICIADPAFFFFFERESKRYFRASGRVMNFNGWYWMPPRTIQGVLDSERKRIEGQIGLFSLVSMTDHDEIASLESGQRPAEYLDLPLSIEWTVPHNGGIIHLGVHNLNPRYAVEILNEMNFFTRWPKARELDELLGLVNECEETLVVLNHPFADLNYMGNRRLRELVVGTLRRYPRYIHALEINGYRPCSEAFSTLSLAEEFGLPVVSGGDPHGLASNAILNLTNASSFAEFVSEVRHEKASEVLLMLDYCKDLFQRKLESVADFFRFCPEYPISLQKWTDRVFIELGDGVARPLSNLWENTVPIWVKSAMWLVGLMRLPYIQRVIRMVWERRTGTHINELCLDSLPAS